MLRSIEVARLFVGVNGVHPEIGLRSILGCLLFFTHWEAPDPQDPALYKWVLKMDGYRYDFINLSPLKKHRTLYFTAILFVS